MLYFEPTKPFKTRDKTGCQLCCSVLRRLAGVWLVITPGKQRLIGCQAETGEGGVRAEETSVPCEMV